MIFTGLVLVGCAASIKVVLGCSPWKTERNYCLIKTEEEEEKSVPISFFPCVVIDLQALIQDPY